jgi:hypothetical protein
VFLEVVMWGVAEFVAICFEILPLVLSTDRLANREARCLDRSVTAVAGESLPGSKTGKFSRFRKQDGLKG